MSATPVPSVAEAELCPAAGPFPSLHRDKEVLLAVRDQLWVDHWNLLRTWHPDNAIEDFEGVILVPGLFGSVSWQGVGKSLLHPIR